MTIITIVNQRFYFLSWKVIEKEWMITTLVSRPMSSNIMEKLKQEVDILMENRFIKILF